MLLLRFNVLNDEFCMSFIMCNIILGLVLSLQPLIVNRLSQSANCCNYTALDRCQLQHKSEQGQLEGNGGWMPAPATKPPILYTAA